MSSSQTKSASPLRQKHSQRRFHQPRFCSVPHSRLRGTRVARVLRLLLSPLLPLPSLLLLLSLLLLFLFLLCCRCHLSLRLVFSSSMLSPLLPRCHPEQSEGSPRHPNRQRRPKAFPPAIDSVWVLHFRRAAFAWLKLGSCSALAVASCRASPNAKRPRRQARPLSSTLSVLTLVRPVLPQAVRWQRTYPSVRDR